MRKLLQYSPVFLLLLFFAGLTNAVAEDRRYEVPIDDSPIWGPADAPVTIIEFLDFQ